MLNFSTSEENYIKAIFHLQNGQDVVTTTALAEKLRTKPASVTDMMKKLKAKKTFALPALPGIQVNTGGKEGRIEYCQATSAREYFLAEKLKFSWDEVHEIAEDLEHVSSKKLIDKLDEFLDFPEFDPHGDPIPDSSGKMKSDRQLSLTDLPLHKSAEVCRVMNQSEEMMEALNHNHIRMGTKLEVKRRFGFDNLIEIKLRSQPAFTITEQLAKNILVRYDS